jgi:hypothetical protein
VGLIVMLREPGPNELMNPAVESAHRRLLIPLRATQCKQDGRSGGECLSSEKDSRLLSEQRFTTFHVVTEEKPLPHPPFSASCG